MEIAANSLFYSLVGGLLILLMGVLYIAFEKSLLVKTAPSQEGLGAAHADSLSRMILGVQVSLSRHRVRVQSDCDLGGFDRTRHDRYQIKCRFPPSQAGLAAWDADGRLVHLG